jgi:hypothetical protein
MNKLEKYKHSIIIFVTIINLSIGNFILHQFNTSNNLYQIINIVLSFILSNYISEILIRTLFNIRYLRKIILGREWLEGIWVLKSSGNEEQSKIKGFEIAEIAFLKNSFELSETVYSVFDNTTLDEYYSASKVAQLIGNDLNWINYYGYVGEKKLHTGIGFGQFIVSPLKKNPDIYNGMTIGLDTGNFERESGRKISSNEIKHYKRKFKDNWMKELIKDINNKLEINSK